MKQGYSVVIPSYNGMNLLKRFLTTIIPKFDVPGQDEILVVDDGSTDGTKAWLKSSFPHICLLRSTRNQGFAAACNLGVAGARNNIVILLNNDVEILLFDKEHLVELFHDKRLFAVAFDMRQGHDHSLSYANRIYPIWNKGLLQFSLDNRLYGAGPSFYACGGGMALDRDKFLALGGFDSLFAPYYWEDTDLSYRAWKIGYQVLFSNRIRLAHYPSSTIGRDGRTTIRRVVFTNMLLFLWKNISDAQLALNHLCWLAAHLFSALRRKDKVLLHGFVAATGKLAKVKASRKRNRKTGFSLSDTQVMEVFKNKR